MVIFKCSTWRVITSMGASCSPAVPTAEKERTRISGRDVSSPVITRGSQANSKGGRGMKGDILMSGVSAKSGSNVE